MSTQETLAQAQSGAVDEISHVPAGTGRVSCDGGDGALGHPRIWLTLSPQPSERAEVVCPYCSHRFVST